MDPSVLPTPLTPSVRKRKPGPASKTGLRGDGALPPKKKDRIADWAQPNSKFMTAPEHQPPKNDKPLEILRIMNPLYSPAAASKASTSSGDDSTPTERLLIQKTRTTCLLCSDPLLVEIVIKSEEGETNGEKTGTDELSPAHQNRFRAVKDLCCHLQFNPKDIPDQYSEDMFPFCVSCQDLVGKISESHKAIQEENRKIDENILAIERRVADAELIGSSSVSSSDKDQKKFLKLREVILDGYRNKLMMKKKARESQLLEDGIDLDERQCSPCPPANCRTVVLRYQDLRNQFMVHAAKPKLDDSEGSAVSQHTFPPNFAFVDPVSHQIVFSPEVESESSESADVDVVTHTDTEIPYTQNGYSAANGMDEENDISMEISDVRSVGLEDSMLAVKQQIPSPMDNVDDKDNCNDIDVEVHQEYQGQVQSQEMTVKKRRAIYRGVDIYRISDGTLGDPGKLQCGECEHTVQINDTSSQEDSAYQAVITHIKDSHLKSNSNRSPKRRREPELATQSSESDATSLSPTPKRMSPQRKMDFVCSQCPEKFNDMKLLVQHRKLKNHFNLTSPTPPAQPSPKRRKTAAKTIDGAEMCECDICGRYVTYEFFLRHRYSHKSYKEKYDAIVRCERGAPPRSGKEFRVLQRQISAMERKDKDK